MNANVHDILSYAADVVLGRKRAKEGESGWAKGEWTDYSRVCLGAALRVAENDLVQQSMFGRHYERDLESPPAIDAERILRDAILQRYGTRLQETKGIYELANMPARDVIIAFNDAAWTGEDQIGEVLELADKMVWERELEAELAQYRASEVVQEPFLTAITQK